MKSTDRDSRRGGDTERDEPRPGPRQGREYAPPRLERLGKLSRVINASGKISVTGGRK